MPPTVSRTRLMIVAALLLLLALPIAAASALVFSYRSEDAIVPGVYVGKFPVGRLTPDAALAVLRDFTHGERFLTFRGAGKEVRLTLEEMGVKVDLPATVQRAVAVGREGGLWHKAHVLGRSAVSGYALPLVWRTDEQRFPMALATIASAFETEPRNARLSVADDGVLDIRPHEDGHRVELPLLRLALRKALERGSFTVDVPLMTTPPRITTASLGRWHTQALLATFETPFDPQHRNRNHNIALAAAALDGYVIQPGSVFSFNETVGPRTLDRGFQVAPEIVDGQFVDGVGGGVCQVSTTLYNTALLAGLDIVERRPHSLPVSYVPLGRDAAVADGSLDLRFRNPYPHPLVMQTEVDGSLLRIALFGPRAYKRAWRLHSLVEELPPGDGRGGQGDSGLNTSSHHAARNGYRVEVWRVGLDETGALNRERVNRSYYAPSR